MNKKFGLVYFSTVLATNVIFISAEGNDAVGLQDFEKGDWYTCSKISPAPTVIDKSFQHIKILDEALKKKLALEIIGLGYGKSKKCQAIKLSKWDVDLLNESLPLLENEAKENFRRLKLAMRDVNQNKELEEKFLQSPNSFLRERGILFETLFPKESPEMVSDNEFRRLYKQFREEQKGATTAAAYASADKGTTITASAQGGANEYAGAAGIGSEGWSSPTSSSYIYVNQETQAFMSSAIDSKATKSGSSKTQGAAIVNFAGPAFTSKDDSSLIDPSDLCKPSRKKDGK